MTNTICSLSLRSPWVEARASRADINMLVEWCPANLLVVLWTEGGAERNGLQRGFERAFDSLRSLRMTILVG